MNPIVWLLAPLFKWIEPYLKEGSSGTYSSKRLLFIASGFTFLGMCIGLTFSVFADPKEAASTLNLLIVTTTGMATGGYLGGKAIDKKKAVGDAQ